MSKLNNFTVVILGCGPSGGVPRPGGNDGKGMWGNCDPNDKRNERTRSSILVKSKNKTILVDTSPDLRRQLLDARCNKIDYVFYTHEHADQSHGIDDLRFSYIFNKERVDIFLAKNISENIAKKYSYIFTSDHSLYPSIARLNWLELDKELYKEIIIDNIKIQPFKVNHGSVDALGYRFDDLVYVPDVKEIYEESKKFLHNANYLIVDCFQQKKSHISHSSLEEVLIWFNEFKPKKMVLTNLGPFMDYKKISEILPDNIVLATDQMQINQ